MPYFELRIIELCNLFFKTDIWDIVEDVASTIRFMWLDACDDQKVVCRKKYDLR